MKERFAVRNILRLFIILVLASTSILVGVSPASAGDRLRVKGRGVEGTIVFDTAHSAPGFGDG